MEVIEEMIYTYSVQYGVEADEMWHVMWCESRGNVNALGKAGEIGIFQYMPNTFKLFSQDIGKEMDIHNPEHQTELTAWAFSTGKINHWTCARLLGLVS